jgi:competence protein ComEC
MAELTNIQDWTQPPQLSLGRRIAAEFAAEQERWFLWLPVLFGAGIAVYFFQFDEPPLLGIAACTAMALGLHVFIRQGGIRQGGLGKPAGLAVLISGGLLAISLGAIAAKLRTDWVAAPVLDRQIGPVEITGWIERVEPRATRGQRITLQVLSFGDLPPEQRPYRIRVRTQAEDSTLQPGQSVGLKATLGPPPMPAAPGDFDFGRLAWFSALGGLGLATGPVRQIANDGPVPWPMLATAAIERLRQAIRARITSALPGETGEIATALITGERGGISEATNQAYRDSGLFHILSISGLHMVIMAGAVFYVLRLGFAAVPRLALNHPIKAWAAAGAIVGAFGYLMISGAAFATVRSYIMITIMFAAIMLDRPALALRNVALAALLILVIYPESLFDAGFQMSFAAVVGLVAAFEHLRLRREAEGRRRHDERRGPFGQLVRFFGDILVSTVIASVVVAPFGIYHFHNTQLLAMIGNVFAIPICNIVVMPAALAVLLALPFGLEAGPLWIMGHGINAMTGVARWVGGLPGAVVKVPAIPTTTFALLVLGGLWLLLWQRPWRLLGLAPMGLGILFAPGLDRPDILVGRDGTSVAVRGTDGRLSALSSRGSAFEIARWLELDGDRRPPADATRGDAFVCDQIGCLARVAGRSVSVAISPAALRDDCAVADVLVLRFLAPRACAGSARAGQLRIDPGHLSRAGAHALYVAANGGIRVATVAEMRGRRPWSGQLVARPRRDDRPLGRISGFTALFERFREPRPEIEDEAWPGGQPRAEPP